jgi:glycosyltransferase 2 family protein
MLDSPGTAGVPGPAVSADVPARTGVGRWLKPIVSLSLYAFIFWFTDVGATWRRIAGARFEFIAAAALLYAAGQALSAWRWQVLTRPLQLLVSYRQLLSFYFIGMFFNLFLPTIVGGDAVKAWLLARETGAVARSTVSVFMERNLGLLALLTIAIVAAAWAPPVEVLGVPILLLTLVLFAGFAAVNLVLLNRGAYALADRLIAATPLARLRPRAASLYDAITPYAGAPREIAWAVVLSLAFQGIVIGVVFLNARALHHDFPLSAVAVFVPLISLGGMLPVSVNGLGVREALYVLLFGRIGAAPELSIALALVYLAVTFAASLPGGILYALQDSRVRPAGSPR